MKLVILSWAWWSGEWDRIGCVHICPLQIFPDTMGDSFLSAYFSNLGRDQTIGGMSGKKFAVGVVFFVLCPNLFGLV